MTRALISYFWPAVCGLLIALVIWLAAPELLAPPPNSEGQTRVTSESLPTDLQGPISYSAAVERAAPSVVYIYTSKTLTYLVTTPRGPLPATADLQDLGTGVIVSREGYVMTNEHVVADADQILVALSDGRVSVAEIVGRDTVTDLAVLKVETGDLTAISIGDPNASKVGDVVLAIGNAQGLQQTVTQGILSGKGRNLNDMDTAINVNFLQTDAAINQGNSGGPLVDVYGDMIGINSRAATLEQDGSVGLGFAIPADVVLKVFRDIVEHGKVIRSWLGVEADSIRFSDEAAAVNGFDQALVVTELYGGGPAHRAGLERGDLILKIDGEDVGNGRRAFRAVANTMPGDNIDFEIIRGNQAMTLTIQAELRPDDPIN